MTTAQLTNALTKKLLSASPEQVKIISAQIIGELYGKHLCCLEALRGDWEINDEGFEAMAENIENLFESILEPLEQLPSKDEVRMSNCKIKPVGQLIDRW